MKFSELTNEQKAVFEQCETVDEVIDLIYAKGIELSEEECEQLNLLRKISRGERLSYSENKKAAALLAYADNSCKLSEEDLAMVSGGVTNLIVDGNVIAFVLGSFNMRFPAL